MVTRADIVARAREYLDVKWVHQGRTMHGIDCAGLVIKVGHDLGLIHYDRTDYQRMPKASEFTGYFTEGGGIKKPVASARPGDILVMRESLYPCHATIVSEKHGVLHIVHAYALRKKVVEEPLDDKWLKKRVACFAYPGVEE